MAGADEAGESAEADGDAGANAAADAPDFRPRAPRLLAALGRALQGPGEPATYRLVRFAILRLLGLVYVATFAGAVIQILPLIGHDGLLPADLYLAEARDALGADAPWEVPTLFWLDVSDAALRGVSALGLVLGLALLLGVSSGPLLLALWLLQLSVLGVGQRFWAFGWETQLLETTLLAMLLVPWTGWRPLDRHGPPLVGVVLMRWLALRIMLGAGLIKLRGDPCWHDLSCLDVHFETQPNPHPGSWLFHHAPAWIHQAGVLFNHLAEVILPFFVFGPRRVRYVAGVILVAFQLTLIASGNLSFLNWLTIIPCLACFDDQLLRRLVPARWRGRFVGPEAAAPASGPLRIAAWSLAAIVAWRSVDVVANLLSPSQSMNRSYDPLHLVNTYGAFGRITRERLELVIEGSDAREPGPTTVWRAYELPCKPGDPSRRPCLITPYHLRLDWLMWFAALEAGDYGGLAREEWLLHLVAKLLEGDPSVAPLLAVDPFAGGPPPQSVRIVAYRYHFAEPGDPAGAWWVREPVGVLVRPLRADDPELRAFLGAHGWER